MKKIFYILIMCLTAIIFAYGAVNLGEYWETYSVYDSLLESHDTKVVYYNYYKNITNHDERINRPLRIFDGIYHFGQKDDIEDEINKTSNIEKVYPYTILRWTGYDGLYKQEELLHFSVDNIEIINENYVGEQIVIIPYFLEDGFDINMEKTFISTALDNYIIKNYDMSFVDKTLTAYNVQIPTSQWLGDSLTLISADSSEESYPYHVEFSYDSISFEIDSSIDYYSKICETSNVILIPYTKMNEILNQHITSNSEEKYIESLKIIYLDNLDDVNTTLAELIALDKDIWVYSFKSILEPEFLNFIETMKTNVILNTFLVTTILIINFVFWFYNKSLQNESTIYVATILTSSLIAMYIYQHTVSFKFILLIITFNLILYIGLYIIKKSKQLSI